MYRAYLPVDALFLDTTYQRPSNPKKVQEIAANFNPMLAGSIIISERVNRQRVVVSGQLRVQAARVAGVRKLLCEIHEGLTIEEEVEIYIRCNTHPPVSE